MHSDDNPYSDLAPLFQARDWSAWDTVVNDLARELYRYAHRTLRSGGDAEGVAEVVVQDTWVKAWLACESSPPIRNLRAWLFRICYHQCVDVLRAREREAAQTFWSLGADRRPSRVVDRVTTVSEGIVDRNHADTVFQVILTDALKRMWRRATEGVVTRNEWNAYVLLNLHGFTPEDAAEILGVTPQAVCNRRSRARKKLADILDELS